MSPWDSSLSHGLTMRVSHGGEGYSLNLTMSPWDASWSFGHFMRAMRGSPWEPWEALILGIWKAGNLRIWPWAHDTPHGLMVWTWEPWEYLMEEGWISIEVDNLTMSQWDASWSRGFTVRAMRGSHGGYRGSFKFVNFTMIPWYTSWPHSFTMRAMRGSHGGVR